MRDTVATLLAEPRFGLANGQRDITVRYIVTQMDALSLKRLTYWPALS